ncbi:hypothetical protein JOM56_010245 [Amanita muscaria]
MSIFVKRRPLPQTPTLTMADQCALGPDGTLLDASKILFYNDPDDETPLPPVPPAAPGRDRRVTVPASVPGCSHGRPSRARDTTRMKQILQAEKADDDGNVRSRSPTPTKLQNRHASTKKTFPTSVPADDTDIEDEDFVPRLEAVEWESGDGEDEEDSEIMITNEELAAVLPSKTVPLTATGSTARRTATQKRKAKTSTRTGPSPPKRARHDDLVNKDVAKATASMKSTSLAKEDSNTFTTLMNGKKNYIYLFYERVAADNDGHSQTDFKYYKCFHGQRKTYTLSPNMKHNLKNMIHHLQNHFPSMYKLYTTLSERKTAPTPLEVLIATNSTIISEKDVNDYLKSLDIISQPTIQSAFDKQTAVCFSCLHA